MVNSFSQVAEHVGNLVIWYQILDQVGWNIFMTEMAMHNNIINVIRGKK